MSAKLQLLVPGWLQEKRSNCFFYHGVFFLKNRELLSFGQGLDSMGKVKDQKFPLLGFLFSPCFFSPPLPPQAALRGHSPSGMASVFSQSSSEFFQYLQSMQKNIFNIDKHS